MFTVNLLISSTHNTHYNGSTLSD